MSVVVLICLRCNHTVQSGPCQRIDERCRNYTKRGGRHEWAKPHSRKCRNEIDQEEWKHGHQAQEQEITEGIFTKPVGELTGAGPCAPQQGLPERGARYEEDDGSSNCRAHNRGGGTKDHTEEKSAGDRQKSCPREG